MLQEFKILVSHGIKSYYNHIFFGLETWALMPAVFIHICIQIGPGCASEFISAEVIAVWSGPIEKKIYFDL